MCVYDLPHCRREIRLVGEFDTTLTARRVHYYGNVVTEVHEERKKIKIRFFFSFFAASTWKLKCVKYDYRLTQIFHTFLNHFFVGRKDAVIFNCVIMLIGRRGTSNAVGPTGCQMCSCACVTSEDIFYHSCCTCVNFWGHILSLLLYLCDFWGHILSLLYKLHESFVCFSFQEGP